MGRDYSDCKPDILQHLVDMNENLQSLFSELDPERIADKLTQGMKEITDITVKKRRVQKRERGVNFWNASLEEERKALKTQNKLAIESGDIEEERKYKNMKNIHTKNVVKLQKTKVKEKKKK